MTLDGHRCPNECAEPSPMRSCANSTWTELYWELLSQFLGFIQLWKWEKHSWRCSNSSRPKMSKQCSHLQPPTETLDPLACQLFYPLLYRVLSLWSVLTLKCPRFIGTWGMPSLFAPMVMLRLIGWGRRQLGIPIAGEHWYSSKCRQQQHAQEYGRTFWVLPQGQGSLLSLHVFPQNQGTLLFLKCAISWQWLSFCCSCDIFGVQGRALAQNQMLIPNDISTLKEDRVDSR